MTDRRFTTVPVPPPPPMWSKDEDEKLWKVVYSSEVEYDQRIYLSRLFPGKTIKELQARINALGAANAAEELWSKEDVDLLVNFILKFPPRNETAWWIDLYSNFPSKTWEQVNFMYGTLVNMEAAIPNTEPYRLELVPKVDSDQTLLPLPSSDANSNGCSCGYGIQNLNTETATAANLVLPEPESGMMENIMNSVLPISDDNSNCNGCCSGNQNLNIGTETAANVFLPEPKSGMMENIMNSTLPLTTPIPDDNSYGYGNLNSTGGYFPMDSNQQPQAIQPYNSYYGKGNQNPNPNYLVHRKLPFTQVQFPKPYVNPTLNFHNYHTNGLVSFPNTSDPNLNFNSNNDSNNTVEVTSNQVTHPNLNMGYFRNYPYTNQSWSGLSHVTEPSPASASVLNNTLQPLPYNFQSPNMVPIDKNFHRKIKTERGCYWSIEEHRAFLSGVANCSWGDWRSISRRYLGTKTPAQIASHAQKYQLRHNGPNIGIKKRRSIHDITLTLEGDKTVLPPRMGQN